MIHREVSCATAFFLFLNSFFAPAAFALPHLDTDSLRAISTKGTDAEDRLDGDPSWVHPASLPPAQHQFLEDRANEIMGARFAAHRAVAVLQGDFGIGRYQEYPRHLDDRRRIQIEGQVKGLVDALSDEEVAERVNQLLGKGIAPYNAIAAVAKRIGLPPDHPRVLREALELNWALRLERAALQPEGVRFGTPGAEIVRMPLVSPL